MDKFKAWFKANQKVILWVGIPILVIVIVFSLPLKTASIPITESYWATEMRTENYTATETFTDMEAYVTSETRTETLYNQAVGYGSWNKTFQVDHPGATVSIEVNSYGGAAYYAPRYYIIGDNYSPYWGGGYPGYSGGYYGGGWSPWDGYYGGYGGGWGGGQSWATVKVTYPEQVTKYRPVSKIRDVVKYREVPTQVRKDRTVMQNVRMSIWESIFR